MSREQREVRRRLRIFEHAKKTGNIRKTCRYFGIPRSLFYVWKAAYEREGEAGLVRKKPIPKSHPATIKPEVVDKVLHLRRTYHLGPIRIVWYLERYHGIKICDASVYRICRRHGLNRLP
jgi:transposase